MTQGHQEPPYLLKVKADGNVVSALGLFAPATEPCFAECSDHTRVHVVEVLDRFTGRVPIGPDLPASEDTPAGT